MDRRPEEGEDDIKPEPFKRPKSQRRSISASEMEGLVHLHRSQTEPQLRRDRNAWNEHVDAQEEAAATINHTNLYYYAHPDVVAALRANALGITAEHDEELHRIDDEAIEEGYDPALGHFRPPPLWHTTRHLRARSRARQRHRDNSRTYAQRIGELFAAIPSHNSTSHNNRDTGPASEH